MDRTRLSFSFSLCALCALCGESSSFAAAPTVTYLFPAGGQVGTTVDVTAGGTFDPWPVKAWCSDPAIAIEAGEAKGAIRVTIPKDAKPGVRYLRLFNEHGPSGLRPFVVGRLPEVRDTEPNDSPDKPQVLKSASVVVNGRLDKTADVDVFAVTLRQGETLVASVDGNRTFKSPMDAVLQVIAPDGFLAAENHDHAGLDPQLVFTAPKDGVYRIRLFAFPAVPDSSIRIAAAETYIYRLTLTTAGFADFAMPLAVPRAKPGTVKLHGWNLPDDATTIDVLAAESDLTFVSHPRLPNAVLVRLETVPTYDAMGDPESVKDVLAAPFVVSGLLDKPGGTLAIRFAVKKAQAITFSVESQTLGLPVVPLLRVRDESGMIAARIEPARPGDETKLAFRPTVDGTYTVEVQDLFNTSSPRHAFLLRAMPVLPDFTLTCPNDRIYVVPGKPTEVKLAMTRIALKADVDVKAVKLPDGITMEVGKPEATGVTLKFTAEKPAIGGSFRLVGTTKDGLVRTAKANDAELGETTQDLWIVATESPKPAPIPKKKK